MGLTVYSVQMSVFRLMTRLHRTVENVFGGSSESLWELLESLSGQNIFYHHGKQKKLNMNLYVT